MANPATAALAFWWRTPILVRRLVGSGPYGDTYDSDNGTEILGKPRWGNRLVRDKDGSQVVSSSGAAFPDGTPRIPLGSLVQLPDSPWRTVIAEAPHRSGTDVTPDYYSIDLD